ncbi:MAG TPA: YicC/YloC family endoribonuclease [Acidobacteriaceae bacterium]|nr:YicC/YloC family endoribonuclease [Acidobacteriaceae bacterium]
MSNVEAKTPMVRPVYSMTGYATAQSATEDGLAFTLTLKSVNHRFLDLNLRLPSDCDAVELLLRRLMKENVKRGHVDVTLYVERRAKEQAQAVQVNNDLLASLVKAFHDAAKAHHFNAEPDLHELLKLPGVLSTEAPVTTDAPPRSAGLEAAVAALAPSLLEQLNQVRGTEGSVLAKELRASMIRLRALAEQCAEIRTNAREIHFERLRLRVTELLRSVDEGGKEAGEGERHISDQRLLAEAALLVERSDIEEELVRLRAHIESFLEMLDGGGELGKRLDFLLQELNREANTMLSKTSGGDPSLGLKLTALGLEMKTEIERAREQVQNLE